MVFISTQDRLSGKGLSLQQAGSPTHVGKSSLTPLVTWPQEGLIKERCRIVSPQTSLTVLYLCEELSPGSHYNH